MLNVSASPSASVAVGRKEYGCPAVADTTGVPLMTGTRFAAACTVIENTGSVAVALPSDTAMAMLEYVAASPAAGVPLNRPVDALNAAHDGLLTIANVSVWPSGSDAVGVNEYAWPEVTEDCGVPLIVGGLFAACTVMENAGSVAVAVPSVTLIEMLAYVAASLAAGVPLSRPVEVLNVAHDGLLTIENVSVWPSGSEAVGVNEYAWPEVTEDCGVPLMTGARFVD
jgi:hypothetical protein